MDLDSQVKKYLGGYLLSDSFKNLCNALNLDSYDVIDIKEKVRDLEDDSNIEEAIILLIYEKYLLCRRPPGKEVIDKEYLHGKIFDRSIYYYRTLIRDPERWPDIENKLRAGIDSGKITSMYLLEKEFQKEMDAMSIAKMFDALNEIYIAEINGIMDGYILDIGVHKTLRDEIFKGEYLANPLYYDDVRKAFTERLNRFLENPVIRAGDFHNNSIFATDVVIEDKIMASFFDLLMFGDKEYDRIYAKGIGYGSKYFHVLACANSKYFMKFNDPSNVFIIKKPLVEDSKARIVNPDSAIANEFKGNEDDSIKSIFFKHKEDYPNHLKFISAKDYEHFKWEMFEDIESEKKVHVLDVLDKKEIRERTYNRRDLYQIASQRPLSKEFLTLLSSLGLDVGVGYEMRDSAKDRRDVAEMLNVMILRNRECLEDPLDEDALLSQLDCFEARTILNSMEDEWETIKRGLAAKIRKGQIKSLCELEKAYSKLVKSGLKANIQNAQIEALLDFKEKDNSYACELARHIRHRSILYADMGNYLNSLTGDELVKMKEYPDEGKYAAPRWLVYPELDAFTIGWRMGYGEDYTMNQPWPTEEFKKLFPRPQNWLFDPRKYDFDRFAPRGYFWREDGRPKYSEIGDDPLQVNDFITVEAEGEEFRHNAVRFSSIEHAVLHSKYALFDKIDYYSTKLYVLKKGFELTDEEIEYWEIFKYTVLLNSTYYRVMQDEELKRKLLETGDRPLVYISDDEWGGDENLFGFALMELRDEIRRLYENEDKIDWEFTEYLKNKDPYEDVPPKRDPEDEQSPEYKIIESTLNSASEYVRDVNLDDGLVEKYEIGDIITERGYVDATSKIGGMVTTHRYIILSDQMADFSAFENGTDWGLHVARRNSKFKIMDIYTQKGKTQIALLHLPEGFEEVFENTISIEREKVEYLRKVFFRSIHMEPIAEVTSPEWLERCAFPLGMSDGGELFED